ncbi:MAG: tRNA uridine-5-carboxymethylaminomethyl(34) synthesis enzyme MnmG [Calditrichaeota bacterium]|nr:tRNA uridine-5-carboxymethylaminomethyl(34) synthesis enzyme MnmG [Calditrichota bacterium]
MAIHTTYDVVVIGGGHAGVEAALATSRMGFRTCLVTQNLQTIGQMSCNPAIGGLAKGQLVKEIDALGGEMGRLADLATVQFRMLNRSKGPAVWSPRAQCDRVLYAREVRKTLEFQRNLDLKQNTITDFETSGGRLSACVAASGQLFECRAAVLCAGTFLNGLLHMGDWQLPGGRIGEAPSLGLSEMLMKHGFEVGRLKTGTPPRLDGRTIDYARCEHQPGDGRIIPFSVKTQKAVTDQLACHLTYTNTKTHDVLRGGLHKSPLFSGRIQGRGPRYCPSIEDKIVRFADKDRHQIFLEPEGWDTFEVYMNGFSSSLPEDVQFEALRTVPGLENTEMMRPGYAVEYDFFPAHQLHYSLETKIIEGLFFAGQINGTTGYEEAAAQGLIAGINTAQKLNGGDSLILGRDQAYIGVLIDDLITKTPDEPYRMFTSRAEHRLILRQDNADQRLTDIGRDLGLVDDQQFDSYLEKKHKLDIITAFLHETRLEELTESGLLSDPKLKGSRLAAILKRPEADLQTLITESPQFEKIRSESPDEELLAGIEMDVKYEGYIQRERFRAEQVRRWEEVRLPDDMDLWAVHSMSHEAKEKLSYYKPKTLGQAGRISGVRPSDTSALLIHLKRLGHL